MLALKLSAASLLLVTTIHGVAAQGGPATTPGGPSGAPSTQSGQSPDRPDERPSEGPSGTGAGPGGSPSTQSGQSPLQPGDGVGTRGMQGTDPQKKDPAPRPK